MMFRDVSLDRLITPASAERAGRRDFPILSMTMHEGLVDQSAKFKKRVASADTSDYKIVRRNQLVVGFPIDEGVLSIQDLYDEAIVSPAYDVWNLSADYELEPAYLERFLRSPRALAFYRTKLRSTTARRRTIPDDVFLRLVVPLPSHFEQRRLAEMLHRAEELPANRRAALRQLDTLTRVIFLHMFGDPATNPKGLSTARIGDLGEIGTGSTPSRSERRHFGGDIPWVKTTEVAWGVIVDTEEKITELGLRASRCKLFPKGSIIVALYGQGRTRGQAAILGIEATTNQACGVLQPSERIDSTFLLEHLKLSYQALRAMSRGGNQENLNLGLLADFTVLLPPKELQVEFARHIATIEELKIVQRAQLSEFDALFASIQYRAFRGEL